MSHEGFPEIENEGAVQERTQEEIDSIDTSRIVSDATFLAPKSEELVFNPDNPYDTEGKPMTVGGAHLKDGTLVDISPDQIELARAEMNEAIGDTPAHRELSPEEFEHYGALKEQIASEGIEIGTPIRLALKQKKGMIFNRAGDPKIFDSMRFTGMDERKLYAKEYELVTEGAGGQYAYKRDVLVDFDEVLEIQIDDAHDAYAFKRYTPLELIDEDSIQDRDKRPHKPTQKMEPE